MQPAFIHSIITAEVTKAFCLMLFHSLWQGLAFTFLTGVVMLFTKKSSALLRYNLIAVLFFLFIIVCGCTFMWHLNIPQQAIEQQSAAAGIPGSNLIQLFLKNLNALLSNNTSLILTVWCLVFFAKCIRMTASLVYCERVKYHRTVEPPPYWKSKFVDLCEQLNIRKSVLLLESKILKIPVVIGHFKPVIFLPVGVLINLPAGEVEAVLLHELAHIRRNDYLVNVIQVVIENVFFFNPALLWMSSLLREERESCCDDVAVTQTKSKGQLIRALIAFKEHALHTPGYATAFAGRKSHLLQRVTRLVESKNKALSSFDKIFFYISLIVLVIFSVAAINEGTVLITKKIVKKEVPVSNQMPVANKPAVNDLTEAAAERATADLSKIRFNSQAKSNAGYVKSATVKIKHNSIEVYEKAITYQVGKTRSNKVDGKQLAMEEVLTNENLEDRLRQQAMKDREQASRDFAQAELDRLQAEKDRMQSDKDREQALKDRQQAEYYRMQALKDRQQAEKERLVINN